MEEELTEQDTEDEPTQLQLWKERAGITELYQSEYDAPLADLLIEYGDKLTDDEFAWLQIRNGIRCFADRITNAIEVRHRGEQRNNSYLRQQVIDVLAIIEPSGDTPQAQQQVQHPEPPTPDQIELLTDRFHILPSVIAKLTKMQAARMIAEHIARGNL